MKDNYVSSGDKWADIEDLIKRWKRRNPEAFRQNMAYIKKKRESLGGEYAKYGGGETGAMRLGLAIHPELLNYIESFHPDFLKANEDVRIFRKRFKNFAVADKR